MKTLIIVLWAMSVAACGFTPLYANNDETDSMIGVEPIEGRGGHALRKALKSELAPGLPGLGRSAQLIVTLRTRLQRFGLEADGATSRSDFVVTAVYRLEFGDTVISGTSQVVGSFLASSSPYGDIAAQIDVSDRSMSQLARQIVNNLRLSVAETE